MSNQTKLELARYWESSPDFMRWIESGDPCATRTRELIQMDASGAHIAIRAAWLSFICGTSEGMSRAITGSGKQWPAGVDAGLAVNGADS